MRIKSPFKDYYDGLQAYTQDDLRYFRTPIRNNDIPLSVEDSGFGFKEGFSYKNVIIGFCGFYYYGYKFFSGENFETQISKYCYTGDQIEQVYDKYGWDKKYDKGVHRYCSWSRSILDRKREREAKPRIQKDETFYKYKTPILVCTDVLSKTYTKDKGWIYKYYVTINGKIGDFDFQRVFPPHQAYQEIRMYLANMGSPEKIIPKIDDVIMAEAKGFDKWSFRKEPSKRK